MSMRSKRNEQEGIGWGGAKPALIAFHPDPQVSGWRRLWRDHLWAADARRVTVLVLSNGSWVEAQWIDGQGQRPPTVWGDANLDAKAALEKRGWKVFAWTVGPEGARAAQVWGQTNNLSAALRTAGIANGVHGWERFLVALFVTGSLFGMAEAYIQATTPYAGLNDWLQALILLGMAWTTRPRRRFRRPEHLARWLERAGKMETMSSFRPSPGAPAGPATGPLMG